VIMRSIQRGFSALGKERFDIPIKRAGEYGFDFVELTMNDYDPAVLYDNAEDIKKQAESQEVDIIVHLPHGDANHMIGSSDERVRDNSIAQMKNSIEVAGEINAKKAVLHTDSADAPLLIENEDMTTLAAVLSELDDYGAECDVEICAENMRARRPTLDDFAEIANLTDISITVDTGHARTSGYNDKQIGEFLRSNGHIISHIHLNDTRGSVDEHLPFGSGTVDFKRILASLPDGWSGTATLEVTTFDYDYIEFSLAKLDRLLSQFPRLE